MKKFCSQEKLNKTVNNSFQCREVNENLLQRQEIALSLARTSLPLNVLMF